MIMSLELDRVAERLNRKLASPDDSAEFIRLIQQERQLRDLERLLPAFYGEFGGVILRRIAELLPNDDPKLFVSLALWNHDNGFDDDAVRFLERARAIAPFDQEVMRCDLWLSVSNGEEDAPQKCHSLLQMYPDDQWAKQMCDLISKDKEPDSIESPRWNNPWEDLINGKRVVDTPP